MIAMMIGKRRRMRATLRRALKDARHVRNLREDLAAPADLERLDAAAGRVRAVLAGGRWAEADSSAGGLAAATAILAPPRAWPALRENLEIVAVALAVAMAFRTYFVQPFKIPTSSMSPSLCGIHYQPQDAPTWLDAPPLRPIKWLVFGAWYVEVRARAPGALRIAETPEGRLALVQGMAHPIPAGLHCRVSTGDRVLPGQVLASGNRIAGDHIFVNKAVWNFRPPRRGEITVFKTDDIRHPQIKTNEHYVKRLVGLPGESLSLDPPRLLIGGRPVGGSAAIARIEAARDGYRGFLATGDYLTGATNRVALGPHDFFVCGDNQANSLDSRYWGPVRRANLVGPAFLVYWPFSRRWGLTK